IPDELESSNVRERQRYGKTFAEQRTIEFAIKDLSPLAHPPFAHLRRVNDGLWTKAALWLFSPCRLPTRLASIDTLSTAGHKFVPGFVALIRPLPWQQYGAYLRPA